MADAQLVLSPLVRVTDANNQPIAGGEIRFYEAGTSTPLVVYSDSDLLTALGSSVNTDDGGYPISGGGAKTLIWTGPDEYKVVVHDADGVPLVTHDNIRGALVVPEAAEASYPKTPVITRTTTTVISTDYESYRGRLINANPGGGSFVITLPSAVTVEDGFRIGVRHAGTSNTVTIRTIGTQTIGTIGQAALKSFALTGLGNTVWLVSNGADWIVDTEVPALINNSYFIVADRLTSPPGSPVAGTRYIINGTPDGAWSTLGFDEDDIAESDGNGSWFRYVPRDGYLAYVADENLLTQWRDSEWVDLTNITAPTESQLQYAVFEHRLANGTNGGTATTGAWTTRTLNTEVINTISGASLAANAITLPVGKYLVLAQQAFFSREAFDTSVGGRFVAQQRINAGTAVLAANSLYGIAGTVGTTLSVGSATGNADTTYAPTDMFVLDVTTAGTINLQYYTTNSQANTALGIASTEPAGALESYARVTVLSLSSLQGPQGIQGSQGNAATIAVGTVTTVAPSVPAAVTNSGTSGAAVFDFNIPKGDTGQDGGQGASGGAVLAYFEWNDATSGDPGSGGVLANNATLASATEVNISKTGPNGEDYSAFLASWAVSTAPLKGHLRINTAADLSEFIDADVTGFTDNSTYVTIALTNVTGAGTPTASATMSVVFMRAGDLGSISVPNYTALKALPTSGAVIVTDVNRGGTFVWRTGDYSALVAIDTAEAIYVASDSDPDGDAGCWVRQGGWHVTGRINLLWCGASGAYPDDTTNQSGALQAALDLAAHLGVRGVDVPPGIYRIDEQVTVPRGIGIFGPGYAVGTRWDSALEKWVHGTGAEFAVTHLPSTKTEDDATFLVSTGSTIQGVCFWYPNQPVHNIVSLVEYAPTIGMYADPDGPSGTISYAVVKDCYATNAYSFVSWTKRNGLCTIEKIVGAVLKRSFVIDESYDIFRMVDVHFNANAAYVADWPSGGVNGTSYNEEATFLEIAKADQPYLDRVFCYGGYTGLHLSNRGGGSMAGGKFVSCGFEGGGRPLYITGTPQEVDFGTMSLGIRSGGVSAPAGHTIVIAPPASEYCRNLDFSKVRSFRSWGSAISATRVRGLRLDGFRADNAEGRNDFVRQVVRMDDCARVSARGMFIRITNPNTKILYLGMGNVRGFDVTDCFFEGMTDGGAASTAISNSSDGIVTNNRQRSTSSSAGNTGSGNTNVTIDALGSWTE